MEHPSVLLISGNQLKVPYPVYPLGVSYLATYLRKNIPEIKVDVFDFNLQTIEQLRQTIKDAQPNVVGISLRNIDNVNVFDTQNFIEYYRSIISNIRIHSKAKVVIGGAGYSIFPERLFEYLQPDFGIRGEGEESFRKLIVALNETLPDFESIEGLVYRTNEGIKVNNRINYTKNLHLEFEPELIDYYWQHSGMLNIQTKRGCPYACDYCSYPMIEGKFTRNLDADLVVENLMKMKTDHNIDYVFFTDSVFNISNAYNIDLAEKIIKSGVNVRWGAYFTPINLDKQQLKLFKASGLSHIEFGTDSLSETMLRSFNKTFSMTDIFETSRMCSELDINFAHFLILGGKDETLATILETMENSKKLPPTVFFPTIGTRIYPGTQLCRHAIKNHIIHHEEELMQSVYYLSTEVTSAEIMAEARKTGRKWVFMDENLQPAMAKMRARGKKGPLWDYIIQ